jgi:hypothetical protein
MASRVSRVAACGLRELCPLFSFFQEPFSFANLGSIRTSVVQHPRVVRPVAARLLCRNRPTEADPARPSGWNRAGTGQELGTQPTYTQCNTRCYTCLLV